MRNKVKIRKRAKCNCGCNADSKKRLSYYRDGLYYKSKSHWSKMKEKKAEEKANA